MSTFSAILPRVVDVLEANVSVNTRTINVKNVSPHVLGQADLPCLITRINGINIVRDSDFDTYYDVTVNISLYYRVATQDLPYKNTEDLIAWFDQIETIPRTNPFLEDDDNGLGGVYDAIQLAPQGIRLPDILSYPDGSTSRFWGFSLNLIVPFQKQTL